MVPDPAWRDPVLAGHGGVAARYRGSRGARDWLPHGDPMRKLIVTEWMTLDGVVQAPGDAEEDRTGGFGHGGWHLRLFDGLAREWGVPERDRGRGFRARAPHVRELRPALAECPGGGAGDRGAAEQPSEVRGVDHADRAARMGELHAAQGRRPRRGRRAQAAGRR